MKLLRADNKVLAVVERSDIGTVVPAVLPNIDLLIIGRRDLTELSNSHWWPVLQAAIKNNEKRILYW